MQSNVKRLKQTCHVLPRSCPEYVFCDVIEHLFLVYVKPTKGRWCPVKAECVVGGMAVDGV